jgi:DNA-binding GntR family transcriptional regulator
MLPPAPAIEKTSVAEQTYRYLRDTILQGHLAPGQRLPLERVCARLGVSRMPVKEAIGRLVSEGLVEVQPRRGTYVARLDAREVAETFDVRGALEALGAELAAARATEADVARLREQIGALEASGRARDVQSHVAGNFAFHGAIVELGGNERLLALYRQLRAATQVAAIHHRWPDWGRRLDEEHAEHEAIVDALERRDAAAVARATREHIERGKREILAGLAAAEKLAPR